MQQWTELFQERQMREIGNSLIHLHNQLLYKCTLDQNPVSVSDIFTEHISALPVY